jgi:hypothetical protein
MNPLYITALALLGAALGSGCCLAGSSDESDGPGAASPTTLGGQPAFATDGGVPTGA